MEINRAKLSPMMQKYFETKDQYPGCILFYRLGDFYEMFFDDAITASKALEITLTGKECGLEERAPMCGVPFHAADNYIDRLVKKGYRVAIAEQMEDPKLAKGLVKREVIRVVTPGTICDNKALDETKNNYIMSIAYVGGIYGVSTCDVSTGEFYLTELKTKEQLEDELFKFTPAEVICNDLFELSGENLDELKEHYRKGGLGDVKIKRFLNNVMQEELSPIRARRAEFEKDIPEVYNILKKGSDVARETAAQTLSEVKRAMKIDYFEDQDLIRTQSERYAQK